MTENKATPPWKNGIYKSSENNQMLMKVDGNEATMFPHVYLDYPDIPSTMVAAWTFGDFGPARKEVQDAASGVQNYNIKMALGVFFSALGIVSEDGQTIYSWGMFDSLDTIQWLDDERSKEHKAFLISCIWEAGFEAEGHFETLAEQGIKGDYMTMLEVLTVIENFEGAIPEGQIINFNLSIDEALEEGQNDKTALLLSLKEVIQNLG